MATPPDDPPKGLSADFLSDAESIAHLVSPLALASRTQPTFRPRKHQKVISDAIVDAISGRGPRFIAVSVPQQFGKSFITSIMTPAWWMELHAYGVVPGGMVGLVSNEDSLAMNWSIQTRRLIAARPDVFKVQLRTDSKAAGFWETAEGGGIIAVGIAGSIVGRPISLLVIDDPTKNMDQATSDKHQSTVWDFWTTVGLGRLQPWTIVLVVMTRWHALDLVGRLTSAEFEGDPAEWRYIRIPAVCDSAHDPIHREFGQALIRPQADQSQREADLEMEQVKSRTSTYTWCTPAETPILMEDFTTKPISEVQVGDSVIGFVHEAKAKLKLVPTRVTAVTSSTGTVWNYKMESGRTVRATKEHRWFLRRERPYAPATVGTSLRFMSEPYDEASSHEKELWQYLAGFVDGEGHIDPTGKNALRITQTLKKNLPVYQRLLEVLDLLGLDYSVTKKVHKNPLWSDTAIVTVHDAAFVYRRLIRLTYLGKKDSAAQALLRMGKEHRGKDKVIAIGNPSEEPIFALETETGNYIAWGYGSSNSTMWQQNPVDPEGTIFFESKWRYWGGDSEVPLPPHFEQVVMSWDMAFKGENQHDWVVGQAWGGIGADRFLIDQVRGHWGFTECISRVQSFADKIRRQYKNATAVLVEDKANGPAIIDALRSKVGGFVPITPEGSKESRAWACQPLLLGGNLYAPSRSEFPWIGDALRELADFPRGAHDDVVDSTTQALLHMQNFRVEPVTIYGGSTVPLEDPIHVLASTEKQLWVPSRRGPIR